MPVRWIGVRAWREEPSRSGRLTVEWLRWPWREAAERLLERPGIKAGIVGHGR